jgi:copper chaperone CopZ
MSMETVELKVIGEEKIQCSACETRVANALRRVAGVENVQASAQTQEVKVTIDPARVNADELRAKLAEIGYQTAYAVH